MGRRLFKELERSYGFDEVAIVPGQVTINPELTSTKMTIGDLEFEIPIMASAMDGAVSPGFASYMHEMGGLGVLNAEGLYSRYVTLTQCWKKSYPILKNQLLNFFRKSILSRSEMT